MASLTLVAYAIAAGPLTSGRASSERAAADATSSSRCVFATAKKPVEVAFCDTFAEGPTRNRGGSRSGELDGIVWGVSRDLGFNNLGQHMYDAGVTSLQIGGRCGSRPTTISLDVRVCGGEATDVVNDNPTVNASNMDRQNESGTVTSLAMYPKQPFDFSDRTGTVVFDVSEDSGGMHAAWPEFWITNLPVPDPIAFSDEFTSVPQYGFGLRLGGVCSPAGTGPGSGGAGCGPHCPWHNRGYVVTVASAIVSTNYRIRDSGGVATPQGRKNLSYVPDSCVTEPSRPGQMNHFEVRVSRRRISVYATNAFTPPFNPARDRLVHLGTVTNPRLGFTRGLIWLTDTHYNASKGVDAKFQAMHTFSWANVGFDGPILPRDLAFDVPDSDQRVPGYPTLENLGWVTAPATALRLVVPGVHRVAAATAAFLTLNYTMTTPGTLTYRVNGGRRQTQRWPFGACAVQNGDHACGQRTIALPVRLAGLRTGSNVIRLSASQPTIIANVDLILHGAGGVVAPSGR